MKVESVFGRSFGQALLEGGRDFPTLRFLLNKFKTSQVSDILTFSSYPFYATCGGFNSIPPVVRKSRVGVF